MKRPLLPILWTALLAACGAAQEERVLFLTHSAGFQHGVVKRPAPDRLALAEEQLTRAARGTFAVDATQDCGRINAEELARYAAVVFYTTGELPIPEEGRRALFDYVRGGGGFVGIHPASDTYYQVPEYMEMVGGTFDGHPWHAKVRVTVEDGGHPATAHLGESFVLTDEIYQFRNFSRERVQVLLSLDNKSVDASKGKREDGDYALAWCRGYGQGRVFYTALGHRPEVWGDVRFLRHVLGGLRWASGKADYQAAPPPGATVLFDGTDLSAFRQADGGDARWTLADGAFQVEPGTGDLYTRDAWRDFSLHVEFRTPAPEPGQSGQGRGNSGVYLQDRYEVQVLDSFGIESPGMGDCGAIYSVKVPDTNACRKPLAWQTYDVHFQAARWNAAGEKTASARVTVYHNGLLIHEDVEVPRSTGGGSAETPEPGPLKLQDHGHPVQYRNVWVVPR